jgi:hypothetical protein
MTTPDDDPISHGAPPVETAAARDEERRRWIEQICARARARANAEGLKPPTPEEIDELLGYNEFGFFDWPLDVITSVII